MSDKQTRDTAARDSFLRRVRDMGHEIDPDEVIARDNVYRIDGQVHLLVRTSRFHDARRTYFFGLTRHIFEHFAQLPCPVIAFVFSDTLETLLVPARWLWDQRDRLNADATGVISILRIDLGEKGLLPSQLQLRCSQEVAVQTERSPKCVPRRLSRS
jgi:hypothetical protein